ncbi:DUF5715 family protein [Candidatus Nomurabacteria bacterium]|nr:DUF5715 family protein [Candidatus Nomurabacteria bacterium]
MAEQAETHDLTHLPTGAKVEDFVEKGLLVRLTGNENYSVEGASYPFVRPAVKLFVERWSAQSRTVCTDGLVVTSSTRPINEQPSNASRRSVHPTGIAVDFRIPTNRKCRAWMERTLLALEGRGVLEATRERRPPHYHVAVFPDPYTKYVAGLSAPVKKKAPTNRKKKR